MKHERCCTTCKGGCDASHERAWSMSEQAKLRSLSLFLIRSIVSSHGGTVDIDLATNTIHIDVPNEEQVACAREIEQQVGSLCY